jgi:beta-carotene hydroxylase
MPTRPTNDDAIDARRLALRAERAMAAPYWGGLQRRIVLTFAAFAAAWVAVVVLGTMGTVPLWLGLIVNTALASTFYMPMHEATHGNIWGRRPGSRRGEDLIGVACSIPLGFSYGAHRTSHMRHHAFTNDPDRDPDHYTDGPLRELPGKWLGIVALTTFLPVFAFVPATRRMLPDQLQRVLRSDNDRRSGLIQLRFWAVTHLVLLVAFLSGFGWPALFLWYLPARLQSYWLVFVFAWFPHHPAEPVGRYVDTRVAVFPGSRWLIRGHDHHAVHHLFPRVPHYRLPALWQHIATDMVAKGVRSEGQALGATGPIIW